MKYQLSEKAQRTALSRVDDCAGLGSVYFNRCQRTHQRRHQAEDHVGLSALLGGFKFIDLPRKL
jgi:hypothetical protein